MGWKGTVRAINSASNKIAKENERRIRQQERETERYNKKLVKIEESREKIKTALNNDYAAGKINDGEYVNLTKRMDDISDELIVFGKSAGVTLGKRYVCGKIDNDQFTQMSSEFIPTELYKERDSILSIIKEKQDNLIKFKDTCNNLSNVCQKCNQDKSFLKPLHKIDDFNLCGKCLRNYKNIKEYNGFDGNYLIADPISISETMSLSVSIRKELL